MLKGFVYEKRDDNSFYFDISSVGLDNKIEEYKRSEIRKYYSLLKKIR
jgi:hypothetical protein